MKDFGNFIMSKRKELKLTLKDVSEHCNVSINFISMVERGKKYPSDTVLQKLEYILKLEDGTLFAMLNKVSPSLVHNIISDEHSSLHDLLSEIVRHKIKDENLREELLDEVYSVYEEFLKRHNLK